MSGAPTERQLAALAPYLSDTLGTLLVPARERNEADIARAPGEKPSFAEGDLFSKPVRGPNDDQRLLHGADGSPAR